jgi:hypothetical protein
MEDLKKQWGLVRPAGSKHNDEWQKEKATLDELKTKLEEATKEAKEAE